MWLPWVNKATESGGFLIVGQPSHTSHNAANTFNHGIPG